MSEKYFPFDQLKIGDSEFTAKEIVPRSMKLKITGDDIDINCMTEGYYIFRLTTRCSAELKLFGDQQPDNSHLPQSVILYRKSQEIIRFRALVDVIYNDTEKCSSVTLTGTEMMK